MNLFGSDEGKACPVCPVRENENAYLRSQVRDLQAKLLEVAAEGSNARLAQAARLAAAPEPKVRQKPNAIDEAVEAKRRAERPAPLPGHEPN